MLRQPILLFALAAFAAACSARDAQVARPTAPRVTIMTFNVENLFDTRDDAGKDDRTFLPLALKQTDEHKQACSRIEQTHWRDQCLNWDWNEQVLTRKLAVLAATILQVNGGRGPDILALQEVENIGVLERLRTEHLASAGYQPGILIEGRDERGIDVAFLSRFPVDGTPVLHAIVFPGAPDERVADTRGILEATFRLPDGSLLTGYAVHFPAPFHPTEMRISAYEHLNQLKRALPPDRAAFAAGDFNTTSTEDREKSMLRRFVRPYWVAVHESANIGKGTNYYARGDNWSFLDMILWSPAGGGKEAAVRGDHGGWALRENSAQIANHVAAQVDNARPARFELPAGTGVSDHWPLLFSIELKHN